MRSVTDAEVVTLAVAQAMMEPLVARVLTEHVRIRPSRPRDRIVRTASGRAASRTREPARAPRAPRGARVVPADRGREAQRRAAPLGRPARPLTRDTPLAQRPAGRAVQASGSWSSPGRGERESIAQRRRRRGWPGRMPQPGGEGLIVLVCRARAVRPSSRRCRDRAVRRLRA